MGDMEYRVFALFGTADALENLEVPKKNSHDALHYTRAFGDGPRYFDPRSSDVWTTPELAPPLLTTTPHQREDVSALDRLVLDSNS
ncbi:hypothetical protein TNCV_2305181 [Trichonephila clavipes]|nr:hypothetical protein TNCV_2305181 [Trichonephila clavipes]